MYLLSFSNQEKLLNTKISEFWGFRRTLPFFGSCSRTRDVSPEASPLFFSSPLTTTLYVWWDLPVCIDVPSIRSSLDGQPKALKTRAKRWRAPIPSPWVSSRSQVPRAPLGGWKRMDRIDHRKTSHTWDHTEHTWSPLDHLNRIRKGRNGEDGGDGETDGGLFTYDFL